MMLGPGLRFAGRHSTLLVYTASLVVLALVLVAPVDGQAGSSEHRFQLVHPIFPHVDWADDGHSHTDEIQADVAAPVSGPDLTILPAGPFGPGPLITTEGMQVPAAQAMLGLWLVLGVAWRQRRLADQTWLAVPTGPPR